MVWGLGLRGSLGLRASGSRFTLWGLGLFGFRVQETVRLGLIVGLSQAPHRGVGGVGGRQGGRGVEWGVGDRGARGGLLGGASTASGPGAPSACGPRFPRGVPI